MRFRVHLQEVHKNTGLTPYSVGRRTGLAQNTVKKYVIPKEVIIEKIGPELIILARFYGVDWRNEEIIELIDDDKSTPNLFKVNLKPYHDNQALSSSRVADKLGLPRSEVRKLVEIDNVIVDQIDPIIIRLADYYGVDWKTVVEAI